MKEYMIILEDNMLMIDNWNCTNYTRIEFYEKNSLCYFMLYSRVRRNQPSNKAEVLRWVGNIRDKRKGSWVRLFKDLYVVSVEQPIYYK